MNPAEEELPSKFCDLICDLVKEPLTDEVRHKAVRAKIKEKGKLSHKGRRWTLDGLISDGTANLKVEFSTQVCLEIQLFYIITFEHFVIISHLNFNTYKQNSSVYGQRYGIYCSGFFANQEKSKK